MKDNLNDVIPDGIQDKNNTLNEILNSVDSRLKPNNNISDWEDEINSVLEKHSHQSEIDEILNEFSPKKEETIIPELTEPDSTENDVQELVEQITVGKKVSELSSQKKLFAEEPKEIPEQAKTVADIIKEDIPQTSPVKNNIPEEPVKTDNSELPTAKIALDEIKSKTIVYNLPSKKIPASVTKMAVRNAPVAEVRKPVKKIVRVDHNKPATHSGNSVNRANNAYSGNNNTRSAYSAPNENIRKPVPQKKSANVNAEKKPVKKKKSFKQKFIDFFPQKQDPPLEKVRKVVFMCSICAIVVCGYMVGDYYIDLGKSKNLHEEIAEIYEPYLPETVTNVATIYEPDYERTYTLLDGAKKLLDMNPDVVGYITIPGTPVANPVMQAKDNSKYLDQNINGDSSRAGELFLDYRNNFDRVVDNKLSVPNSDNLVIYGHNMANDTMFGSLKYYQRNYNYYNENPVIYLNSNYECYTYKIFSYFILDALDESETAYDCWNKFDFDSEEDFYNFVNEAKKRSLGLNDVDVKYGDKLVTLSTCNTILGDRGRLIVMGRLLRDGEDVKLGTESNVQNANVKWPSIYYQQKPNEKYNPDAEFVPYG